MLGAFNLAVVDSPDDAFRPKVVTLDKGVIFFPFMSFPGVMERAFLFI
jgi:hypothetical protein